MRDALEFHLRSPACTEDFNESLRTPNFPTTSPPVAFRPMYNQSDRHPTRVFYWHSPKVLWCQGTVTATYSELLGGGDHSLSTSRHFLARTILENPYTVLF